MQNPTRIGRPAILRGGKKAWQVVAMPGNGSWVAPRSGLYRIHSWGAGGAANSGVAGAGTGGAYQQKQVRLAKGDTLTITIGRTPFPSPATTITGPGGLNMNTGATNYGNSPPTPTGGDINVPASGSGSVAAASSPDGIYRGGGYTYGDQTGGYSPGGGAQAYTGGSNHSGSGGMVIIEEFF